MKSFKGINGNTYDIIAQNYRSGHEVLEWKNELDTFTHYVQSPQPLVLDLGSGHGIESEYLAQKLPQGRIYAVDISTNMLSASPKKAVSITYIHHDMVTYKPIEKVDGVWARASIHHLTLEEIDELFRNISGYLNKGGVVGMVNKYGRDEEVEEREKYGQMIKRYFQYIDEGIIDSIVKKFGFSLLKQYKVSNDHEWLVSFLVKK